MLFSFPLYLACEFSRRSRGSQHHLSTRSIALNLTSLLHQGSPGTCRWRSRCCFYEANTQNKQGPATTHLVPNFSRKRLVRLYGWFFLVVFFLVGFFFFFFFALKSFSSLILGLMGQSACKSKRDCKHQWIYSKCKLPAGVTCELWWTLFFFFYSFSFLITVYSTGLLNWH